MTDLDEAIRLIVQAIDKDGDRFVQAVLRRSPMMLDGLGLPPWLCSLIGKIPLESIFPLTVEDLLEWPYRKRKEPMTTQSKADFVIQGPLVKLLYLERQIARQKLGEQYADALATWADPESQVYESAIELTHPRSDGVAFVLRLASIRTEVKCQIAEEVLRQRKEQP